MMNVAKSTNMKVRRADIGNIVVEAEVAIQNDTKKLDVVTKVHISIRHPNRG